MSHRFSNRMIALFCAIALAAPTVAVANPTADDVDETACEGEKDDEKDRSLAQVPLPPEDDDDDDDDDDDHEFPPRFAWDSDDDDDEDDEDDHEFPPPRFAWDSDDDDDEDDDDGYFTTESVFGAAPVSLI